MISNKLPCFLSTGDMYWRYDDEENRVQLDYPRDISMWKGVPHNIDAAFQYIDQKTYFFKGTGFWEFNDAKMEVVQIEATPVGEYWFQCPKQLYDPVTGSKSTQTSLHSVFMLVSVLWAALYKPAHPR